MTEAKVTLVNQIQQQDINAHNPPEELFDISYYYSKFPAGDINKLNIFHIPWNTKMFIFINIFVFQNILTKNVVKYWDYFTTCQLTTL